MRLMIASLALLAVASQALGSVQTTYLVKGRKVDSVPEALSILRRFIPTKFKLEDRCERYAVLLNTMSSSTVDHLTIASLGLSTSESIRQKYRNIDVETLRQLYFDSIQKSLETHLDSSLLDLYDCLSDKFRLIDAKARSFLNDKDLKETVEQYKSIMSQPLLFLLGEPIPHPTLAYSQLKPIIKQTLIELFSGNEPEVIARFPEFNQRPQPAKRPKQQPVEPPKAQPQARPAPVPQPKPQPQPQVAPKVVKPTPAVAPEAASVQSQPEQVKPSLESAAAVEALAKAGSLVDSASSLVNNLDYGLSKEEQEYLKQVIDSIHDLYATLPVESKLSERCAAYSEVLESSFDQLKAGLVSRIVDRVAGQLGTGSDEKFLPDKEKRDNFMFTLSSFGPEKAGDEAWIDLIDCVSQWVDDDQDVKEFMDRPEQKRIFDMINQSTDELAQEIIKSSEDGISAEASASA